MNGFQETSIIVVRHDGIVLWRLCKWTRTNLHDILKICFITLVKTNLTNNISLDPTKESGKYFKVLQNSLQLTVVAFLTQPPWKLKMMNMGSNTGPLQTCTSFRSLSGLSPSAYLISVRSIFLLPKQQVEKCLVVVGGSTTSSEYTAHLAKGPSNKSCKLAN